MRSKPERPGCARADAAKNPPSRVAFSGSGSAWDSIRCGGPAGSARPTQAAKREKTSAAASAFCQPPCKPAPSSLSAAREETRMKWECYQKIGEPEHQKEIEAEGNAGTSDDRS